MNPIGRRRWAIAEGYIPEKSMIGADEALVSHEAACILNASDTAAHVEITIFFADREPAGPYRLTVEAQRTRHLRFNDLNDPAPVPRGTSYASVIESDVPIVVQHTRAGQQSSGDRAAVDHGFCGRLERPAPASIVVTVLPCCPATANGKLTADRGDCRRARMSPEGENPDHSG